jgi:hypothetical protein
MRRKRRMRSLAMKQTINLDEEELITRERAFILLWKKRRYHNEVPILTIGEVIELLIGVTHNLHFEESDGRFFNNILLNNESSIGWEGMGGELIDILFYELRQALKTRFSLAQVFEA